MYAGTSFKHALHEGQPPSFKRARHCHPNAPSAAAPSARCELSAPACRQLLQNADTMEEALDALLCHNQLLHSYCHLEEGPFFYLTYALAHAIRGSTVDLTAKCLHVMQLVVYRVPGASVRLKATGVQTYIHHATFLYPCLQALGNNLVQTIDSASAPTGA